MVLPCQNDAGFCLWRVVVTRRRDKLLIAGWAVYDVQLHAGQGCRGAMAGYLGIQEPRLPGSQAPRLPGPWVAGCGAHTYLGTPPVKPVGLHRQGRAQPGLGGEGLLHAQTSLLDSPPKHACQPLNTSPHLTTYTMQYRHRAEAVSLVDHKPS